MEGNVITLSEGDDVYRNDFEAVTINALGGNDTVFNAWNDSVAINGGSGNDSLENRGENGTLTGGAFFMRNS